MMKKIIFAFLIFFVLAGQLVCFAIDGKTLLEDCAAAVQKMDGKTRVSGVRVELLLWICAGPYRYEYIL